jgi:hypothetical protein
MDTENSGLGAGKILRAVLLFIAGFAVGAAGIHLLLRDPLELYGAERSEKLEILRRSGFGFSSAIFGSSHVQQGFDPRAFDAGLEGTPFQVQTLNLAADGGSQVEQRAVSLYFLDHLRLPTSGQPCLAMLEASAPPTFHPSLTSHPRQINIIDLPSLELVRHFALPQTTRLRQLHLAEMTWEAFFYHEINMGMLSNKIFRPPFNEALIAEETKNDQRGMQNEAQSAWMKADVENSFAHALPVPVAKPGQLEAGHAMLIEELEQAPHGDKVQFVWVVMPGLEDLEEYKVYPASVSTSFGEVPILDAGRPDLYPELYDRSVWLDNQHLNAQGAKLASQVLARLFLAWAHDHPVRQNCGG